MSRKSRIRKGFTLIEILVVVAIIALLIAILLPSLAAAKDQAKMVACQSNLKSLGTAFATYATANRGRFPGSRKDNGADFLGRSNPNKLTGTGYGRQPEDGTIYRYMGQQKQAYRCPTHDQSNDPTFPGYSYTMNVILSGAKPEVLAGGHYPAPLNGNTAAPQLDRLDHRVSMRPFPGAPLLIEEHNPGAWVSDSGWCANDGLTNRHLKRGNKGYGNIGFHDTHVERFQFNPPGAENKGYADAIQASYLCVKRVGLSWVSGRSYSNGSNWALSDNGTSSKVLH